MTTINPQAATSTDRADPGRLVVDKPDANAIKVISLDHVTELVFSFSLTQVKVAVLDVDVILIFPDGAKIILPAFAFAVVASTAPEITTPDGVVAPQKFLAMVGDTKLSDQLPSVTLTAVPQQANKGAAEQGDVQQNATGPGEADPAPPPSPMQPARLSAEETEEEDGPGEADPIRVHVVKTESFTDSSSASSTATKTEPPHPPAPPNPNTGNDKVALLAVQLLGIGGQTTEDIPGKGILLKGGPSHEAAETDPAFETQMRAEALFGSSAADVIYADDPAIAPEGTSARLIDGHVTLPTAGWTATAAIIYGLPDGYPVMRQLTIRLVRLSRTRSPRFVRTVRIAWPWPRRSRTTVTRRALCGQPRRISAWRFISM